MNKTIVAVNTLKISVSIKEKKFYIGLILALVSLLACLAVGASMKAGVLFCAMFLVLAPLKIECAESAAKWLNWIWGVAATVVVVALTQLLLNQKTLSLGMFKIFMGALCVSIAMVFFLILTANLRVSVISGILALMLLATVNYYVFRFRGNEFAPYDFFAVKTALAVAGEYSFAVDAPFVYAWAFATIYILCGFCIPGSRVSRKAILRYGALVAEIVAILVLLAGLKNVKKEEFVNLGSARNGYLLNFVRRINFATVHKPADYDLSLIKTYEDLYKKEKNVPEQKPNVIVIMNESFADLRILGNLETNDPITPFYDSLQGTVIHGYALASSIGGGTCNSEFQMLTGSNMGFLPSGTYPYQQYLKSSTYSIFSAMEQYGYDTLATHPANGANWMRTTVYPLFGVDELQFLEDYPQKDMLRTHISDKEMYEQVIAHYEKRSVERNLFVFGVTVQNHGGYLYEGDDWQNEIHLSGYSQEYPQAEQYLTLMRHSDRALESFITYFENRQEPVVIVFFGDHLPNLDAGFYEELHGGAYDTLEERMLQYTVPFFVWANYEIDARDVGLTSLNFLSNYVYEAAGLPLPAYNAFLKDVQTVIPAMNAFGYYSKTQDVFVPYEQATGKEAEILNIYRILQYNCLFDKENRSDVFFPLAFDPKS